MTSLSLTKIYMQVWKEYLGVVRRKPAGGCPVVGWTEKVTIPSDDEDEAS
jgi:hypothetical protein